MFLYWNRCTGLSEVNVLLRSQLSQSTEANDALRDDLRKLTADWSKAVEEVMQKEIEWQNEKEVRNLFADHHIGTAIPRYHTY